MKRGVTYARQVRGNEDSMYNFNRQIISIVVGAGIETATTPDR